MKQADSTGRPGDRDAPRARPEQTWNAAADFPATSWTLLQDARTQRAALERLFEVYLQPMYAYLKVRCRTHDRHLPR